MRRPLAFGLALVIATSARADHELLERDIAAGAALYQDNCAACHGANLEGQPDWQTPNPDGTMPAPPHDVSGHTWHHDNQLLFDYTKFGGQGALAMRGIDEFNSAMPAFDGVLTDDEIWEVLAYVRSTWPPRAQEVQASRNRGH